MKPMNFVSTFVMHGDGGGADPARNKKQKTLYKPKCAVRLIE